MSRGNPHFWAKYKYMFNGLLLTLPIVFLYQSLNPQFPDGLGTQRFQNETHLFDISAMPFDDNPPYLHDGVYVKDFMVSFTKGNVDEIRQAYLNIGEQPLPLATMQIASEGILHGSRYGKHVHALTHPQIQTNDKVWLTLEFWDGRIGHINWDWR